MRQVGIVLGGWAALGLTILMLPGLTADNGWSVLFAAVLLGLFGVVIRPAVASLMARIGWVGVLAGWLLAQAALLYLALALAPGIRVDGFWTAFWASWIYSALISIALWVVTAGRTEAVTRHLLWVNRRYRGSVPRTELPGVVFVQIDGLSAPLARWALDTGNLPTLGRWLRSGSHALAEWHAQLPATTPASQAGLLHGASDQVPAFRWYEKESGRLIVTNQPADAAVVESRLSDGRGLLADGGLSLSNVFSGDATTSLLTMSTARAGRGPARYLSSYLLDPFGLTRSLVLTFGEIVKELHQARRQRVRRVEPRIRREPSYVLLRGVTNVLLRQLNLAVLAEHLMRGTPSIYCDFVDYDEIAHHAGPARPEALAALEGIDAVLANLEEVAAEAPRPYEFVILSDHGQSQGATFRQRYGLGLEDLVRGDVAVQTDDEQAGRALTLRASLLPGKNGSAPEEIRPEFVVVASGNLGLVYLARQPGRLTMEEIEKHAPGLVDRLATHPGVGWVMVRSQADGPMVLGGGGRRLLDGDVLEGPDPLAGFGPFAADDLRRHDRLAHTPDILVNSLHDPETGEVAAFEELVGCHGGLGGWQDRPVLIHPRAWPIDRELSSSDAVHAQLKSWLDLIRAG
ncbi:phage holin family protein [Actinoplanes sp. KI2]|uniref:phage holin family protein n=1 Tax=Actinoplanes sp. KI2 TaxID=2983315 RepID=UPI0021D5D9C9|nr:phage holin family protein [Actinoplanes sp. KI2]MCU7730450.1 phage holin family protein [Actinoplanes sp. KI2]